MKKSRQNLGIWGEKQAVAYLVKQGYTVIVQNARTPYGEIDIIATKDDRTVFLEVKTRSSLEFGFPEESITPTKREHLIHSAQAYLLEHPDLDGDWQIDVIAVQHFDKDPPIILHFENAIAA